MKVEQLNNVQIDWTKPQVVVNSEGSRILIITNYEYRDVYFSGVDLDTGHFANDWIKESFKPESATSYPIELKLTIESDEELCNLIHRSNKGKNVINENDTTDLIHKADDSDTELYVVLDELAKERNLYKNY